MGEGEVVLRVVLFFSIERENLSTQNVCLCVPVCACMFSLHDKDDGLVNIEF